MSLLDTTFDTLTLVACVLATLAFAFIAIILDQE